MGKTIHPEIQLKLKIMEEKYGKKSSEYQMEEQMLLGVQDLLDVLGTQGHSGFSVGYAVSTFETLVKGKTLSPLTGDESEWNEPYEKGDTTQQNKRCGAIFRENGDNSTAYYINGKAFSDDGGDTFYTSKDSFVPVTFPCYVPETEYVILGEEKSE